VAPNLVFAAVAEEVGALFDSDVTVIVRFEPDGEATVMRWRTELRLAGVLGKLAGAGGEAVARRQADRTLDEVTRRL